jgi:poly(ADP-ribose) glycohydrolase
LAGVASGNWGCGAYRGDAKLKTLLQLMAASQAGRHLAYFTFGDTKLQDQVFHMYTFLTDKQVSVGKCLYILIICILQTLHHVIISSEYGELGIS